MRSLIVCSCNASQVCGHIPVHTLVYVDVAGRVADVPQYPVRHSSGDDEKLNCDVIGLWQIGSSFANMGLMQCHGLLAPAYDPTCKSTPQHAWHDRWTSTQALSDLTIVPHTLVSHMLVCTIWAIFSV